jgi:hypothetical protein
MKNQMNANELPVDAIRKATRLVVEAEEREWVNDQRDGYIVVDGELVPVTVTRGKKLRNSEQRKNEDEIAYMMGYRRK